jgi:hypothetical protein
LGVRAEQCGAVTFLQRFGSALNLNLHFHTLALDGAEAAAPSEADGCAAPEADRLGGRPEARPRRLRWAALLQRVFGFEARRCPRCGATLRLIAAIEDPAIARRILECLDLPARAPPITPATSSDSSLARRSEIDEGWDFDQTPPGDDP